MPKTIAVAPTGHLQLIDAADDEPGLSDDAADQFAHALEQSTPAALVLLASSALPEQLPAEAAFWRSFSQQFFHAACQRGEGAANAWKSVSLSGEATVTLIAKAPPMRGLEYLNADLLQRLWIDLADHVATQAASFPGGGSAYLQSINPLWHLLGRVTFHLAENKRDSECPFAFLATYSHRQSGKTKVAHLPLAEALKMYATARDRNKLDSLLEPVRRAAEQSPLVAELLSSKALFAPQAWTIGQAYRFLTETPRLESAGVVVRVPNWWSARRPPRPQVKVEIGQRPASQLGLDSLLDFRATLALDGQELTAAERQQLLSSSEGLVLLRGQWVEVDREQLKQALDHWRELEKEHHDGLSFVQGMRLLAGASIDEEAVDDRAAAWSQITAGDSLRNMLEQIRHPSGEKKCQPGRDLRATLRPYQAEGVQWLWFLTQLGLGACLADDMGLGKTIQVIDLILQRKRTARAPNLLVVPASLIGNWKQELMRFAPQLRVRLAHRSETSADELARLAKNPGEQLSGTDLVLTTYGLARKQVWLAQQPWSLVILDEAQAIKNASSAQARCIKKLPAQARIALTGTPVENHLGDLWSLFDFCCPGLLGNAGQFKRFVKRLACRDDNEGYAALRRLVRPYILRRLKTDPAVAPDLPDKTEMRTECNLSKKQAVLYEKIVDELSLRLKQADGIARRGIVLAALMQLKQVCNHPSQFLARSDFREDESGKFQRLRMLCEPIVERQEKALIFTQFQALTQPLARFLADVFGRPGLVLHGGTPVRRRSELVRMFQDDAGPPFFVVSLKAGGSGLNLTAATHVVHFDRWWNPAVENQATDRAFRIGQTKNVLVHKFVCRGTVEERIDGMLNDKQGIADQILNAEVETSLTEMGIDELLRFVSLDIARASEDS
jgi:SNF2 domain-containing protein/SNF2 helicase protein/helicase-like protein